MKLNKKIISTLESSDFRVCSVYKHNGEVCAEIETFSPAGEDVIIAIWYDGTSKDFIQKFRGYAEDFDADEHAEMWVDSRGKNGVPSTIRELIEDADEIKSMLLDMSEKLEAA